VRCRRPPWTRSPSAGSLSGMNASSTKPASRACRPVRHQAGARPSSVCRWPLRETRPTASSVSLLPLAEGLRVFI
jgi:hypothetical protein